MNETELLKKGEKKKERENCEFASYELIILRYVTSTKANLFQ